MTQKLIRSTSIVSAFTMLSRLAGFARDIILASVFGAGGMFDAFVVAFKLPNFLRRLFGEGAFSQAFVPMLAEYRATKSHEEVQNFINHVAGMLALAVLLVVVIAEIAAPLLIMIFAPGFYHDPTRFQITEELLRIMFPYLWLIVLAAFAGAMLNTYGIFGSPAFTPILLNLSMIAVAMLWSPHTPNPVITLGYGVIIGGVLQLLVQLPFLRTIRLVPRFRFSLKESGVLRVIKRMVPALFGVSVAQIGLLIDGSFASFLPKGSISWLYFSDRLIYFPLGLIGVALATVVMPYLSRNHAEKNDAIFSSTLDWSLRCTFFIGMPCAVGLLVLAGPILSSLIHYGKFNAFDVIMTAKSLRMFAIGLPAFMLIKILASAFYAKQNIGTPVRVAAIALVANIIFNFIFIFPLKHAGLALATSLSSMVNASLLWFLLEKRGIFCASRSKWQKTIVQLIAANVGMGLLIFILAGPLTPWLTWPALTRLVHLAVTIISGIFLYIFLLWATGVRLRHFRSPH